MNLLILVEMSESGTAGFGQEARRSGEVKLGRRIFSKKFPDTFPLGQLFDG